MSYWSLHVFQYLFEQIRPNSHVSDFKTLWFNICTFYFRGHENWYTVFKGFQANHSPDISVSSVDTLLTTRDVLIMECKAQDDEHPFSFHALGQVSDQCFDRLALSGERKVYCAVSIGIRVKFYIFDMEKEHPWDPTGKIKGAPEALVVEDNEGTVYQGIFDLEQDQDVIELYFQHIKNNPAL